jgi:conjugal transfer ATP-binding protein TraC
VSIFSFFKPREGKWTEELPYRELHDGVMHLHSGQYEGGVVLEVPNTAFMGGTKDLMLAFRHVTAVVLPGNARLRFTLETGPARPGFLDAYKARITAEEPALRRLLEKRIELFEEDWEAGDIREWRVYCSVRLGRRQKNFLNLTAEEREERTNRMKSVTDQLVETFRSVNFEARAMTSQDIFALCYRYLNPGLALAEPEQYRPSHRHYPAGAIKEIKGCNPATLRTRLGKSAVGNEELDHITVGNQYVKMFAMHTLPTADTFPGMVHAAEAAGRNFFLTIDVLTEHAEKTMEIVTNKAKRYEAAAETPDYYVDPETRVLNRETRAALEHAHETGDKFYECSVGLTLFDPDPKVLERRVRETASSLAKIPGNPFMLLSKGVLKPYLDFAPLSGNEHDQKLSLTTTNITHLFPITGPWKGSQRPVALYRNRYYGLTRIDPFDREADAYNGLVIGQTGAGKTFYVQHLLSEFLADKTTQVVIIDRGSGYAPLVDAGHGVKIPITVGGGTSINPFDIRPGATEPTDDEKTMILGVLRAMIPGEGGSKQEIEDAIITAAITQVYAFSFRRLGNRSNFETPTLSSFVRKLEQLDEVNDRHMSDAHRDVAKDLAMRLQQWTGDSALGRFVDRQTNIPLSDARVVYYDTEGVRKHPQLRIVGTLLINNLVFQRVQQRLGQETMIVLDEAWALIKESAAGKAFVEELFRRLRTTGSGALLVTQSYDDVKDIPGIVNNAPMMFCLKVNAQERELWARALKLPKDVIDLAERVNSVKGEYTEALCIFRRGDGYVGNIIAVHPTKMDYWTFTTDNADKAKREAKIEEHGSLDRAMPELEKLAA